MRAVSHFLRARLQRRQLQLRLPVMLPYMHPQVALLLGPVRTLRTLEHRLFSATFNLLVPAQRRFPPVAFSAMTTCELRLATVAWSHDLPGDYPEFPHRATVIAAPGAGFLYRVPEQLAEGGVRLRS